MDTMRALLALPDAASSVADGIDRLHVVVIGVTMAGWAALTIAGTWFVIHYRRRHPTQKTRKYTPPAWFEVVVIGGLLTIFLTWWVVGFRQYVALAQPPPDALEIYVVGKQWMWKFAYPDGYATASTLTVPTGRPVRLVMTSRDVIHSFFVPAFRLKHDVVPGRYTSLWFTVTKAGTYEVYCTEYCGLEHSLMRAVVVALEPDAYESWLHTTREAEEPVVTALEGEPSSGERITQPPPTLAASSMAHQGELLAARYGCLNCHTVDGRPHIGPSWAGLYGTTRPLDSDATVFADETYITRSMMDPTREVVRGFAPVMPSFQGLLGAAETSAIVEYIKSLRSGAPAPVIPPWTGTPPPVIGARP